MTYLNIPAVVLRNEVMTDATHAQKGVWLTLMAYCVEQENGGKIRGVFAWSEIKLARALGVQKSDLFEGSPLWTRKGDDLEVEFYPKEKQRIVQAKRKSAHAAAIARWANRSSSDSASDRSEESVLQSDHASDHASDHEMRKGMEGKGREEKGISPLPPLGESAEEGSVGSEVPTDEEVVEWADGWAGDLARAIPAGIPEAYTLNWLAWRKTPKAGSWPANWQEDLVRRFTRDWVEGNPRARGSKSASGTSTRDIGMQIRALEERIASHPGNPDNSVGSLESKRARRPEWKELSEQLDALRRQQSTVIA